MAHYLARRSVTAVSFAALALAACDDAGVDPTPEALEERLAVSEEEVIVAEPAPLFHLTDFTGTFDATTGELTIVQTDPEDWAVIDTVELADGTLRTIREPLWCEINIGRAPGRIEINTVVGSTFDNPEDCGFGPTDPFYSRYADDTGMFCATVAAFSHATEQLDDVHAQLTFVTDGFFGHRYPFGTGANPAALPDGPGVPNDLMGLWSFGDLAPSGDSRVQWSFENPGGSFAFSGSLVGTFAESCNGVDDNCDGRVDEGGGCFADGAICTDGSDCISNVCTDDRCGLSSVEGSDLVQVGGGGPSSSPGHNVDLRIGVPVPAGTTESAGHNVVLGPVH